VLYFMGKVDHHIFAGGLVVNQYHVVAAVAELFGQLYVGCVFVEHSGMVKNIYNLLFYDFFKVAKVYHHAVFYI